MSLILGGARGTVRQPRFGVVRQIAIEEHVLSDVLPLDDGRYLLSIRDKNSQLTGLNHGWDLNSWVPGPATGLYIYDEESGGAVPLWLSSGLSQWELRWPGAMTYTRDRDAVWVCDRWSEYLHKVSLQGYWMDGITVGDGTQENRVTVSNLYLDPYDNVWALDPINGLAWSYGPSGSQRLKVFIDNNGPYDRYFWIQWIDGTMHYEARRGYLINAPYGIGRDQNGFMWVSTQKNDQQPQPTQTESTISVLSGQLLKIDASTGAILARYDYPSRQGFWGMAVEDDRIYAMVWTWNAASSPVPIVAYDLTGVQAAEYASPDFLLAMTLRKEPGRFEFWLGGNRAGDMTRLNKIGY